MTRNHLVDETSPYLLQHKDNPVHWHPWGPDALAAAKRENKPILLSVGYAACHWCHVMAHESFEDDTTAALMNEHFINIKVDREERPDLDNIYQHALGMMGEHGGWPLTMFLTPEGAPFWGGTYFPPTPRYGRPSFTQVLESLSATYRSEPDKITDNAARMRDTLNKLATPAGGGEITLPILDEVAAQMIRHVDPINGGTHGAPKFPQVNFFQAIWRAYIRTKGALFREAVTSTLSNICQGGIYDHLGGGFSRYSVDAHWLAPHFEKMLYDNALLIELMCEVWPHTNSDLYRIRTEETINWLLADMRSTDAVPFAFTSAYDADSEGEEGKYYVWTEHEIDNLLGERATRFKAAYDVTPHGNWEGKTILNRSADPDFGDPDLEPLLHNCRQTLLTHRATRIPPQRDDKVLADWNGMAITALVKAGAVFNRPDWVATAQSIFDHVKSELANGDRLFHSWCAGRASHPAVLEDYANLARAALALHQATGNEDCLTIAAVWVDLLNKQYWDADHGGYFMSADDTTDLITRAKSAQDNATPSGNGTMIEVLARLHHLTGNSEYREKADALILALAAKETTHLAHQPTFLTGFEILENPVLVAVTGTGPGADALVTATLTTGHPRLILTRVNDDPSAALPVTHPAHGKGLVDGSPAAYVCVGQTCSLPITDFDQLAATIHNTQ